MYSDSKILYWDHQISPMLIELIQHAQKEIIIVSPYVKMWNHLKYSLDEAKKRGVQTSVYYRIDENKIDINELLPFFTNIIPIKNLHAKIYFIDDDIVVSSMNLYDYSQSSNKEIALLLKDQNQKNALRGYLDTKLKPFAERVQRKAVKFEREKTESRPTSVTKSKSIKEPNKPISDLGSFFVESTADYLIDVDDEQGTCIRCGIDIEFDPDRPFCGKCYREWAKYENEDYKENYCHDCGEKAKTSYAKPLCYDCYTDS